MAEIAFHYLNTHTVLHRLDPRSKVALLVMFSIVGAGRYWWGLIALTPIILFLLFLIRMPFVSLIGEIKGFFAFFLAIVVVSAVQIPFAISIEGLATGLMTVARMAFVILIGVCFTGFTKSREMRDAIWWLFKLVPHVNPIRLATMFSLSIRFIPLIFSEAAALKSAQAARGSRGSGRPLRRIRYIGFPLVVRSFRRVESITRAMTSRAYDEANISPELGFHARDFFVLLGAGIVCAGAIWIDSSLM